MKIVSSVLDAEMDPAKGPKEIEYTCDAKDQKINMIITDVPADARTLILTVEDTKMPGNKFNCCMGWNVLKPNESPFKRPENKETEIKKEDFLEEDNPADNTPNTDFYEILCKPGGFVYKFKVYALDNEPKITKNLTKEDIEEMVKDHTLDSAEVTAVFKGEKL